MAGKSKTRQDPYQKHGKAKAPVQETAAIIKDFDKMIGEITHYLMQNNTKIESVKDLSQPEFKRYKNFKDNVFPTMNRIGDLFREIKDEAKTTGAISSKKAMDLLLELQKAKVLIIDSSKLITAKSPQSTPPNFHR